MLFIVFDNFRFFENIFAVYPINLKNIGFLASLVWGFAGTIILILSLVCNRLTIKPIIITLFILSSFSSYFMDVYNVVINEDMLNNIVHTDIDESLDLFSIKLCVYINGKPNQILDGPGRAAHRYG